MKAYKGYLYVFESREIRMFQVRVCKIKNFYMLGECTNDLQEYAGLLLNMGLNLFEDKYIVLLFTDDFRYARDLIYRKIQEEISDQEEILSELNRKLRSVLCLNENQLKC